jgi:hypothetical protein
MTEPAKTRHDLFAALGVGLPKRVQDAGPLGVSGSDEGARSDDQADEYQ